MIIKKKYNSHLSRVIKLCFSHSYNNIKPGLPLSSKLKKNLFIHIILYIFINFLNCHSLEIIKEKSLYIE